MDSAAPQNEWLFYSNVQLNCMAKRSFDHHHHHDLRERLFHWKAFDFECYYAFRNADARSKEMSRWFYEHWSTTLIYEMDGWKWKKKPKSKKKKNIHKLIDCLDSLRSPLHKLYRLNSVVSVGVFMSIYLAILFCILYCILLYVKVSLSLLSRNGIHCINGRKEAIS